MENIKFKEQQSFNDAVMFIMLKVGLIGSVTGLVVSCLSNPYNITKIVTYVIVCLALASCIWWLRRLRLKVSITEKRIKFKLFPLHKKAQKIYWDEVKSCEVVKTPLSAQWHGSNIRFSGEYWYSLTGRNGLSIETKDGEQYFIGFQNVDGLVDKVNQLPIAQ